MTNDRETIPGREVPSPTGISTQTLRGTFYTGISTTVTMTLGLFRSIVMARLLVPEHFGTVALAFFFINLVTRLRGFALESAFIHLQDQSTTTRNSLFTARLALEILKVAVIAALLPLLRVLYPQMGALPAVTAALTLTYAVAGVTLVPETILRKDLEFRPLAVIEVASSAAMTLAGPLAAWAGWGVWALVMEHASGISVRALLAWGPYRTWTPVLTLAPAIARIFWDYGKPSWVQSNLNYLWSSFGNLWTGTRLGDTALGYLSRAWYFGESQRRVFGTPLVGVFGPVFAQIHTDRRRLSRAFEHAVRLLLRVCCAGGGLLVVCMPEFIHFVLGTQWIPMLWTFRALILYSVMVPVLDLAQSLLMAAGKPQATKRVAIAETLFFVPMTVIAVELSGVTGVALAASGTTIVACLTVWGHLRRLVDFSPWRLVGWPVLSLMLACSAAFSIELVRNDIAVTTLILKAASFAAVYSAMLLVREGRTYIGTGREIWSILRQSQAHHE